MKQAGTEVPQHRLSGASGEVVELRVQLPACDQAGDIECEVLGHKASPSELLVRQKTPPGGASRWSCALKLPLAPSLGRDPETTVRWSRKRKELRVALAPRLGDPGVVLGAGNAAAAAAAAAAFTATAAAALTPSPGLSADPERRAKALGEYVGHSLATRQHAVIHGFLAGEDAQALAEEVMRMHANKQMKRGEVEAGLKKGVRDDHVAYVAVNGGDGGSAFAPLAALADRLVLDLQERLGGEQEHGGSSPSLGGVEIMRDKAMVTCYDGKGEDGARYVRHIDNAHGRNKARVLTGILYLNEGWNAPRDGGCLRLYPRAAGEGGGGGDGDAAVDVSPELNTFVLFWSDSRAPHEVLPSRNRARYAISFWWYNADIVAEEEREAAAAKTSSSAGPSTHAPLD